MLLITEYIYFSFYERFVYLSDDKLIAYLDKYQTDFDDLEESYYDDKTKQTQIKYYYYDGFVSESPESKSFLEKHKKMIVGINDMTWRNGLEHKKMAEHALTGKPSNTSYTYEDALLDCRKRTHLSFVMKNISYVKLLGLSLKGPYYIQKNLNYINDKNNILVREWLFFQQHPELYNGYFEETLSDTQRKYVNEVLPDYIWGYRASNISSDEFTIDCKGLTTQGGFKKVKLKWFIKQGPNLRYCGADWVSLPFVPFFEGIHFNP